MKATEKTKDTERLKQKEFCDKQVTQLQEQYTKLSKEVRTECYFIMANVGIMIVQVHYLFSMCDKLYAFMFGVVSCLNKC